MSSTPLYIRTSRYMPSALCHTLHSIHMPITICQVPCVILSTQHSRQASYPPLYLDTNRYTPSIQCHLLYSTFAPIAIHQAPSIILSTIPARQVSSPPLYIHAKHPHHPLHYTWAPITIYQAPRIIPYTQHLRQSLYTKHPASSPPLYPYKPISFLEVLRLLKNKSVYYENS